MSQITAFGTYVPEKIVDNHYFEKFIDTNDEWIISRTGIRTRRFSKDGEYTSDLGVKAVQDLVDRSGKEISDVDFIVVCTTSPDQPMPNAASRVQYKLGIENCGCNDIYAACAGFVYGLQMAHGFVNSGIYKKVLVIGAETLSKITDFEDRTSCILFGDAAGAALVEPGETEQFLAFNSGTNGDLGHDLYLSHKKNSINGVGINANSKIVQNGRSVFKWAVGNIPNKIRELVDKAGLTLDDIDYIVPHSANLRIIEAIVKSLDFPMERVPESVTEFGNTSSASIPLAIAKSKKNGGIKKGDIVLMIGFGGGLTFAGTIVRWEI
ncbi:3-oxoacyl-[acyl-carrier-protein] synthase III [Ekhidna lutea]|uniref:Beta-ketoacyl-[acyl-carrier-protein] synthase III n=1 Tax=Ekhidna lutea TaxID=447679 RepID=A0A239KFB8_EKHLU|nr:ketoacyl-ACP synthase III [Ekhidna lutea]SNT16755.1 3-oxoacyl-[acyl-carrier-protein] synthase III [Ekhidna lutea]